jgi:hypothetical protein
MDRPRRGRPDRGPPHVGESAWIQTLLLHRRGEALDAVDAGEDRPIVLAQTCGRVQQRRSVVRIPQSNYGEAFHIRPDVGEHPNQRLSLMGWPRHEHRAAGQ